MSDNVKEEEFQHGEIVEFIKEHVGLRWGYFCGKHPKNPLSFLVVDEHGNTLTTGEVIKAKGRQVTENDIGKMIRHLGDGYTKGGHKLLAIVKNHLGQKFCICEAPENGTGHFHVALEISRTIDD